LVSSSPSAAKTAYELVNAFELQGVDYSENMWAKEGEVIEESAVTLDMQLLVSLQAPHIYRVAHSIDDD
jgi:hypothetical protein